MLKNTHKDINTKKIIPIILCGGMGSRLWPVSRASFPKYLINLQNGHSFFQNTFLRASSIPNVKEIITVTNSKQFFKIKQQIKSINTKKKNNIELINSSYILEPRGKSTAPAICVTALSVIENFGEDTILLVMPADHIIEDNDAFIESVNEAVSLAKKDKIVTFGVLPTSPETGYGYIKRQGNSVIQFIEKPCQEKANKFIGSGEYLWNAGIFCFSPKIILQEIHKYSPEIYSTVKNCYSSSIYSNNNIALELDASLFAKVPNKSIDYSVMEKSKQIAVVSCDFKWHDIGSWQKLSDLYKADSNGNRLKGNVMIHDSRNCVVETKDRTVALVNVKDLIVIDTQDALLVANSTKSQNVKHIFSDLQKANNIIYKHHKTIYFEWGSLTILEESPGFLLRRVELNTLECCYLTNKARSQWIVISGEARISKDKKITILKPFDHLLNKSKETIFINNLTNQKFVFFEIISGNVLNDCIYKICEHENSIPPTSNY